MYCQQCSSQRILSVSGKCNDCCSIAYDGKDSNGYVPNDLNIGGEDYIEFNLCLDCGQLQGKFPVSVQDV